MHSNTENSVVRLIVGHTAPWDINPNLETFIAPDNINPNLETFISIDTLAFQDSKGGYHLIMANWMLQDYNNPILETLKT